MRRDQPTFNITSVWETYTGKGVLVAVVDDGVDGNHPELFSNYVINFCQSFLCTLLLYSDISVAMEGSNVTCCVINQLKCKKP